jgi:hypothetical protein
MYKQHAKTHHHHHQRREAVKQGGLEGLLASVPVLAFLKREEFEALGGMAKRLFNEHPAVKEVTATAERKYGITAPMVLGAVIIGGAVLHGAWRGIENAKRAREKHQAEEAKETSSYRDREDIRRSHPSAGRQH